MTKVSIFASGNGSNAEALMQKARELKNVQIAFILTDKTDAGVIARAGRMDVPVKIVPRTGSKEHHEQQILSLLADYQVRWILLAGYMRLLSADFLNSFSKISGESSRVVNIHPSLLPAYPGKDSIARAFADQVSAGGVTLHFVDEGMDTGKVIQQRKVPLMPEESLESWSEKIHALEHQMYTEFLTSLEES